MIELKIVANDVIQADMPNKSILNGSIDKSKIDSSIFVYNGRTEFAIRHKIMLRIKCYSREQVIFNLELTYYPLDGRCEHKYEFVRQTQKERFDFYDYYKEGNNDSKHINNMFISTGDYANLIQVLINIILGLEDTNNTGTQLTKNSLFFWLVYYLCSNQSQMNIKTMQNKTDNVTQEPDTIISNMAFPYLRTIRYAYNIPNPSVDILGEPQNPYLVAVFDVYIYTNETYCIRLNIDGYGIIKDLHPFKRIENGKFKDASSRELRYTGLSPLILQTMISANYNASADLMQNIGYIIANDGTSLFMDSRLMEVILNRDRKK